LHQICKKINVWKLPSSFSRTTLIPFSEKSSWSLETSFWKKREVSQLGRLDFLPEYPKTMKFRDLQGSPTLKTFFMTVLEFIGQFFSQNDVFKLQEVFAEHGIRVFLENGLGSFQTFLILQI
jgi:hypothetical protein